MAHKLNLVSNFITDEFEDIFDVVKTVAQISSFIRGSYKREKELQNIQLLLDYQPLRIIKYVSTRWLSLGACLSQMIKLKKPIMDFLDKNGKSELAEVFLTQDICYVLTFNLIFEYMNECNKGF